MGASSGSQAWPALPLEAWSETCATLHMWTQIVGKIRLAQSPWINHSWHVTLYVTARGLTTSPIPMAAATFEIDFDFIDHQLIVQVSDGRVARLAARTADRWPTFYGGSWRRCASSACMWISMANPTKFPTRSVSTRTSLTARTIAEYANRFWRILVQADRVFKEFRGRFIGKCSPVHFFWGAPDLAVTRFSGRRAPEHPGGVPNLPDWVTREAYSHEVSSCGFWPGGGAVPYAAFYSYAYPQPAGFAQAPVGPMRRSTAASLASSSFPTTPSGRPTRPIACCSNSCKPRMRPRPIWLAGIAGFLGTCGLTQLSRSSAATPGPGLASAGSGGFWQKLAPGR